MNAYSPTSPTHIPTGYHFDIVLVQLFYRDVGCLVLRVMGIHRLQFHPRPPDHFLGHTGSRYLREIRL